MQSRQFQTPDLLKAQINNKTLPQVHNIKPTLKRSTAWRGLDLSDPSYISKYKPKLFSNITISKLSFEQIGMNGLRKLRKALKDSKTVSSLTLNKTDLTFKQLTYLFSSTNHWKEFSFSFPHPEQFKGVLSRFGRCKDLELLPLAKQEPGDLPPRINPKIIPCIERQFRGLKKMKSMTLKFPFDINATIFNSKPPRSLQNLHIIFQNNAQELFKLYSSLQKCNQLEHLSLAFLEWYQIAAEDVQMWSSFFQNTPKTLKKITLHLNFDNNEQLEQIQPFIMSLGYLQGLTSLDLSFGSFYKLFYSSDHLFSSVFAIVQQMTKLEELKLSFTGFQVVTKKSLNDLPLMLQSLKNLKTLEIELPPPEGGLESISESLKDLAHLKILDIRLPQTEPNKKSMEIFSNHIAHHQLTSLSLGCHRRDNFEIWEIQHFSNLNVISGIKKLVSTWEKATLTPFFGKIQSFTQLSQLHLRLSPYKISTQEWKSWSGALNNLQDLSSLFLTLPKFDSKNNFEGLQSFLSCLPNLPKLASLNLSFNKEICDQEVGIIASYLARCQSLRSLTLRFQKSSEVGDPALYFLLSGIRALLTLEDLSISCCKEKLFGDKAVIDFLQGLTVLKNLSEVLISLNFSIGTREENITSLLRLEEFYNLRRLTVFKVNSFMII